MLLLISYVCYNTVQTVWSELWVLLYQTLYKDIKFLHSSKNSLGHTSHIFWLQNLYQLFQVLSVNRYGMPGNIPYLPLWLQIIIKYLAASAIYMIEEISFLLFLSFSSLLADYFLYSFIHESPSTACWLGTLHCQYCRNTNNLNLPERPLNKTLQLQLHLCVYACAMKEDFIFL